GVWWTREHVGDAIGDVPGGEDFGLFVEGVDHLVSDLRLVVRAQLGCNSTGLEYAHAHVPLGNLLPQGLREPVHAELGEAIDTVAVPGHAASDRADVDDVGNAARAVLGS